MVSSFSYLNYDTLLKEQIRRSKVRSGELNLIELPFELTLFRKEFLKRQLKGSTKKSNLKP